MRQLRWTESAPAFGLPESAVGPGHLGGPCPIPGTPAALRNLLPDARPMLFQWTSVYFLPHLVSRGPALSPGALLAVPMLFDSCSH